MKIQKKFIEKLETLLQTHTRVRMGVKIVPHSAFADGPAIVDERD